MYNHTKPYDGIIPVLKKLKENNVKIGVVSNKFDTAVKELCKKYFDNLITSAAGQSDNMPTKPAPNGIFKVMKDLNADKKTTIYAGDSDIDVQTAKNAGLSCIGVLWGFREKEYLKGADFVIENPFDIINIVRSK